VNGRQRGRQRSRQLQPEGITAAASGLIVTLVLMVMAKRFAGLTRQLH
jgi:hypothetical protein